MDQECQFDIFGDITDIDILRALGEMEKVVVSLRFWIETIQEEEDHELLKLGIEALSYLTESDMKHLIRSGQGDYHLIQQKCIDRGLV